MIKKSQFIFIIIYIVIAIVVSMIFTFDPLLMILLFVYCLSMVVLAGDSNNHIFMIFFLITFFVFLLGRPIAVNFLGISKVFIASMTDEATRTMYIALILSVVSLMLGYWIAGKVKITTNHTNYSEGKEIDPAFIESIRKITRIIYIFFGLLLIIENGLRMVFVFSYGYEASYISYVSIFPSFLDSIIDTTPVVFALYLATMPSKMNCAFPFIIYLINAGVYGLIGLRYELISSFMLIFLYFFLRNHTDEVQWITKKGVVMICIAAPFVVILLQFMSSWRAGNTISDAVKSNPIGEFLYAIGGSSNLIGYQEMHHSELAAGRNIPFSFGYVINALRSNILAKLLGISSLTYTDRTDQALLGYSFDRAISYAVYHNKYLNGYGAGSCYIAELMFDYSYIGVIIGNLIYGILIKKIRKLKTNHVVNNFLCIFLSTLMFRVCRDSFSYPLEQFISLRNILLVIIIVAVAKSMTNKNRKLMGSW